MSRDDVVQCRSCGAEMVFLKTVNGKDIPINAETVEDEDVIFEHGKHVSHFATCPQAPDWRKPK